MNVLANPATTLTVRAAAHVHSEWSDDASWPLARIAAAFGRRHCSVVLMSEHSRGFSVAKWEEYIEACAAASNERVTLVPGIEYGDGDDVVHVPVWGRVPFFGETLPIGDMLKQVSELDGTAVWAHPWRRDAWRRFDPSWQEHLAAIEVWNRKYDGVAPNRKSVELSQRLETHAFVSLDFHTRRQLFPLSLALQLDHNASEGATPASEPLILPDDVYAALHARRFAPRALGLPLESLTGGLPAAALRTLESGRRIAARLVN
jgi:hypothetical protein